MLTINPPLKGELIEIGNDCRVHSGLIKAINCRRSEGNILVTYLDNTLLIVSLGNPNDLDFAYRKAIRQWEESIEE